MSDNFVAVEGECGHAISKTFHATRAASTLKTLAAMLVAQNQDCGVCEQIARIANSLAAFI